MEKDQELPEDGVETDLNDGGVDEGEPLDDIDEEELTEREKQYLARAKKAEQAIVNRKKAEKADKKETQKPKGTTQSKEIDAESLERRIEERLEFYSSNPEAKKFKKEIEDLYEDLAKKWFSREKVFGIVSMDNEEAKTKAEPKVVWRPRVNTGTKTISQWEYLKLRQDARDSYRAESIKTFGELRFT